MTPTPSQWPGLDDTAFQTVFFVHSHLSYQGGWETPLQRERQRCGDLTCNQSFAMEEAESSIFLANLITLTPPMVLPNQHPCHLTTFLMEQVYENTQNLKSIHLYFPVQELSSAFS